MVDERYGTAVPGAAKGAAETERAALRAAVARVRRELADHPADLPDRGVAEEALASLAAVVVSAPVDTERLRHGLLLVVAAVGSVSALSAAVGELRAAAGAFGPGAPV